MTTASITRRTALKQFAAAGLAAPLSFAPTRTPRRARLLLHASFGASGMALSDIRLADRKQESQARRRRRSRSRAGRPRSRSNSPTVKVYQDWRELLDKEKDLNSVNVSTPDHMHAPITMRAMQQGLHVYTQKPLTQTIYEARQLTPRGAREKDRLPDGDPNPFACGASDGGRRRFKRASSARSRKSTAGAASNGATAGRGRSHRSDSSQPELGLLARRRGRAAVPQGYYHPGEWRKRSISAPARSATWAVTFSTRCSAHWP